MSLRILRGFTLIADDDKNLHLEIDELKLPTLEEKSVDFTPGGSTGETDVPLGITSKLEIPFKLISHNPLIDVLFGRPPGVRTPFTGRKSLFDDEDDTGRVIEASIDVRGRLMKVDPEQMKGGDKAGYDHMISAITWYQEVHDGTVIRQFNFKRGGWTILDGKPANDAHRSALAI